MIAVLAAGSIFSGVAAIPLASADDDLSDRRQQVQGDISHTLDDLDQSSAELVEASRAYATARSQLRAAQSHLAETRGELAAAEALDQQMQSKLEAAVRDMQAAQTKLAEGRADFGDQAETLGQIAVQNYQNADPALLGLSMVLTSQDPTSLTSQLGSVRNVLDKETVTLDRLKASRILLTVQEEAVQAAKRRVSTQRVKAAENLAHTQRLEAQALTAESQVLGLSQKRAAARDSAASAREADVERLRGLQQERDRISDLLRERAEAARQEAARKAAAAASAAAAEAAAAEAEADAAAAAESAAAEAEADAAAAAESAAAADVPDTRNGSGAGSGFLDYPLDAAISSSYGMRLHPVYREWALHDGTDFAAPCGTPIRAAATGTVVAAYYNAGYGNRVVVDNGFTQGVGLGTAYNHLSSDVIAVGERISRGEVIGYVGSTGYSTGCHLHFMVFENGTAVDPMNWL